MKYKKLKLYKISEVNNIEAVCASGDAASTPASCNSGPEASGGGCNSGIAATTRCTSGAAAGTACTQGDGFE